MKQELHAVVGGPKGHSLSKTFFCHSLTTASRELTAKSRARRDRAAQNGRALYTALHKSNYKWLFLHLEVFGNQQLF